MIRRVEMAEGKPKSQSGVWRTIKPFVNGGASGMLATCVIQPIDMVKVYCRSSFPSSGLWLDALLLLFIEI